MSSDVYRKNEAPADDGKERVPYRGGTLILSPEVHECSVPDGRYLGLKDGVRKLNAGDQWICGACAKVWVLRDREPDEPFSRERWEPQP